MASLQTGNPNRLALYATLELPRSRALAVEAGYHETDGAALVGEWFDGEPDDVLCLCRFLAIGHTIIFDDTSIEDAIASIDAGQVMHAGAH